MDRPETSILAKDTGATGKALQQVTGWSEEVPQKASSLEVLLPRLWRQLWRLVFRRFKEVSPCRGCGGCEGRMLTEDVCSWKGMHLILIVSPGDWPWSLICRLILRPEYMPRPAACRLSFSFELGPSLWHFGGAISAPKWLRRVPTSRNAASDLYGRPPRLKKNVQRSHAAKGASWAQRKLNWGNRKRRKKLLNTRLRKLFG